MNLDDAELRVLGCLVEKQRTTPDQYPLSLNGLRLACNQATNRDPVVEYDEIVIRTALAGLSKRGYARLASGPGSRAAKYRHLFDEAVGLDPAEISALAVLMLRGPQTAAEIRQRAERLHGFDAGEVEDVLDRLGSRELVERAERRPGEKGERYRQLLGDEQAEAEPVPAGASDSLEERIARLEEEVARLRDLVDD